MIGNESIDFNLLNFAFDFLLFAISFFFIHRVLSWLGTRVRRWWVFSLQEFLVVVVATSFFIMFFISYSKQLSDWRKFESKLVLIGGKLDGSKCLPIFERMLGLENVPSNYKYPTRVHSSNVASSELRVVLRDGYSPFIDYISFPNGEVVDNDLLAIIAEKYKLQDVWFSNPKLHVQDLSKLCSINIIRVSKASAKTRKAMENALGEKVIFYGMPTID